MPSQPPTSVRVDTWLWAVRLFPSRSQATAAVRAGHVSVGGQRAKASTAVTPGARITVTGGPRTRIVVVKELLAKRVGAPIAAEAMIDESPPPPPREERFTPVFQRDRGAGRPTKRDRRRMDRMRGF